MNVRPLKTAASCERHGERTYACLNCGQQVTRKACETWHQDQCDNCITMWAYERAVANFDREVEKSNRIQNDSLLRSLAREVEYLRADCEARGLIPKK